MSSDTAHTAMCWQGRKVGHCHCKQVVGEEKPNHLLPTIPLNPKHSHPSRISGPLPSPGRSPSARLSNRVTAHTPPPAVLLPSPLHTPRSLPYRAYPAQNRWGLAILPGTTGSSIYPVK